jgi:anthranilate synthase/aminodeoxychorismate synthase-like glutamine amidotransferase
MFLIIDNYDSFVYNLDQYLAELGCETVVYRNDAITVEEAAGLAPEAIIISPGPCTPDEAGASLEIVEKLAGKIPILGVCLGHQVISQAFGGRVYRSGRPVHGRTSAVRHDGRTIYEGLAQPFEATRYHSLVVEEASLPDCLEVTARTDDGTVMGVRHANGITEGVQFHPESILTTEGKSLLANFIGIVKTCQTTQAVV